LFNLLAQLSFNGMKNVKITTSGFFGGIGQAITGAIKPLMDADGAKINLVVEDNDWQRPPARLRA
jgi:hypothetical protein